MKKIRLELDALSVESFEVAEAAEQRGTVRGHLVSDAGDCPDTEDDCTLPVRACYDSAGCYTNDTWCFYDCGETGYYFRKYPVV